MTSRKSELARNKTISERNPIDVRIGHMVCIEIARCPAEFRRVGNGFQEFQLFLDAFGKNQNFFSQAGWGGRLTVCPGEHGDGSPDLAVILQLRNEPTKVRKKFNL